MSSKILALGLCLVCFTASAQERMGRNISVTGNCIKTVTFDRAAITVTADVLDNDLQKATKRATESYEAVRTAVQKLNLKDAQLMTSEYNVSEQKEWEKDRAVSKGFRARMGLQVTTSEISRLGEVIAIAAKLNVRDVSALNSFLSDAKAKTERESCLEEAVQNAQSKASRMAKVASAKIGRALMITEEGAHAPEPIHPRPMAPGGGGYLKSMSMESAPTVEAGASRMSVNVNVTYALE